MKKGADTYIQQLMTFFSACLAGSCIFSTSTVQTEHTRVSSQEAHNLFQLDSHINNKTTIKKTLYIVVCHVQNKRKKTESILP